MGRFEVLNAGNLAVLGGTASFIDKTVGLDRVADPGVPGGFRINQAQGELNVTGTLSFVGGDPGFTAIGQTTGGIASGAVTVGTLNMLGQRFNSLTIGVSGADGQATGSFSAGSGNLGIGGGASIGTTTGGTAQGTLALGAGGQLLGGGGGALNVGTASGNAGQLVQATGTVGATGGVTGFGSCRTEWSVCVARAICMKGINRRSPFPSHASIEKPSDYGWWFFIFHGSTKDG